MVDDILRRVQEALGGDNSDQGNYEGDRDVRPSSEDPYGDPADEQYGNVRPASEDPYGDPADEQYGNVRPASEDPYGDPADQGYA